MNTHKTDAPANATTNITETTIPVNVIAAAFSFLLHPDEDMDIELPHHVHFADSFCFSTDRKALLRQRLQCLPSDVSFRLSWKMARLITSYAGTANIMEVVSDTEAERALRLLAETQPSFEADVPIEECFKELFVHIKVEVPEEPDGTQRVSVTLPDGFVVTEELPASNRWKDILDAGFERALSIPDDQCSPFAFKCAFQTKFIEKIILAANLLSDVRGNPKTIGMMLTGEKNGSLFSVHQNADVVLMPICRMHEFSEIYSPPKDEMSSNRSET